MSTKNEIFVLLSMTKMQRVPKQSSYAAIYGRPVLIPYFYLQGDIFVRGPGMSDDSNIDRSRMIFLATSIYSDSSISIADEDDDWNSEHPPGPAVGSFSHSTRWRRRHKFRLLQRFELVDQLPSLLGQYAGTPLQIPLISGPLTALIFLGSYRRPRPGYAWCGRIVDSSTTWGWNHQVWGGGS